LRIGHDGDETPVFGGRAEHRGASDVDVFDRVRQRAAFLGNGILEAIQIDDDHVDQVDLVFPEGPHVAFIVPEGEQTAVDLRMQGLQPSIHHLRKTGVVRYVSDRNAVFSQLCRGSARGEDLHAVRLKPLGEFDDPFLVGYADQHPSDVVLPHVSPPVDLFSAFSSFMC